MSEHAAGTSQRSSRPVVAPPTPGACPLAIRLACQHAGLRLGVVRGFPPSISAVSRLITSGPTFWLSSRNPLAKLCSSASSGRISVSYFFVRDSPVAAASLGFNRTDSYFLGRSSEHIDWRTEQRSGIRQRADGSLGNVYSGITWFDPITLILCLSCSLAEDFERPVSIPTRPAG